MGTLARNTVGEVKDKGIPSRHINTGWCDGMCFLIGSVLGVLASFLNTSGIPPGAPTT